MARVYEIVFTLSQKVVGAIVSVFTVPRVVAPVEGMLNLSVNPVAVVGAPKVRLKNTRSNFRLNDLGFPFPSTDLAHSSGSAVRRRRPYAGPAFTNSTVRC